MKAKIVILSLLLGAVYVFAQSAFALLLGVFGGVLIGTLQQSKAQRLQAQRIQRRRR